MMYQDDVDRHEQVERQHPHRDSAQVARYVLLAIIVGALVAMAMDNRHDVRLGYVFGDGSAPVWIVILIAAAAGVVIGWLIKHRPRHRR